MQKCTEDNLTENFRESSMESIFERYNEASLHQVSSECVPLEILSIHSSEKRKCRDGQVDRKNVIALESVKGFLDGRVADVRPERRAKIKPVSC